MQARPSNYSPYLQCYCFTSCALAMVLLAAPNSTNLCDFLSILHLAGNSLPLLQAQEVRYVCEGAFAWLCVKGLGGVCGCKVEHAKPSPYLKLTPNQYILILRMFTTLTSASGCGLGSSTKKL